MRACLRIQRATFRFGVPRLERFRSVKCPGDMPAIAGSWIDVYEICITGTTSRPPLEFGTRTATVPLAEW